MWRWCLCALLCARAIARHDDDFAFDNSEEYRAEILSNKSGTTNGLRRLWGIPDTTAYSGRLFRMEIPSEAFLGDVLAYKVRGADGRRTPSWLAVDARHGLLSGVPLDHDVGIRSLVVTAHGHTGTATDAFTVEVKRSGGRWRHACSPRESRLGLVLVLGVRLHDLRPKQRTRALMRLANFMALDGEELYIESYKSSALPANQSVLQSGPGSTPNRRDAAASAIYIHVGCGGKLWPRHKVLVAGTREQARDGTLAHTLELPVLGWRLLAEKPVPLRPRRQTDSLGPDTYDDGSGDYDDYDDDEDAYSGDGDDIADYEEPLIKPEIIPDSTNHVSTLFGGFNRTTDGSSVFSFPTPAGAESASTRRIPDIVPDGRGPHHRSKISAAGSAMSVPAPTDARSASTPGIVIVPVAVTSTTEGTTATQATEPSSPIEGTVTEVVDFGFPPTTPAPPPPPPPPVNQPPKLQYHIKKLAITAGKAFRYLIPQDLFTDAEDNVNLTYSMFDHDNMPLKPTSWVQFIPDRREVFGLPLDEHVSRWGFTVQATDSAGAAARAPLDIIVQQYKGQRTLNHQFTLKIKLQHKYRYAVDWQIDVLEGLVNLLRTTDMENIVVRAVGSDGDLATFSWSDDTFAKDVCPTQDVERLMSILESPSEPGSPSANLSRAMQPNLKVASVSWSGVGACAARPTPPPRRANNSSPPLPRNQVDHLRATAGHLLVFKVPEDTFYDPDEGGTRHLKLSLIRGDRTPLPSTHWLQFDTNNQEFYGLPTDRDRGKKEYQLIAEDSTGESSNDVLLVEVNAAPNYQSPVEFTIAMKYPYASLAASAAAKRAFVESLAALFGDKDTSHIRVKSIADNPTTVVWYNTSLPQDRCPHEQMRALKDVIVRKEDGKETLTDRVHQLLDKHDVMSIQMVPRGACAREATVSKLPPPAVVADGAPGSSSERALREYVVTVIVPAAVVVCMILLAAAVAFVLYRRRLTAGKMSVGDEEERQAFRSRGIPVIFQDELDDKPDPGNKSPVIMKEEKPPLLPPPDYRLDADSPTPSHHTPYRPPPPFTASRDRNVPRPKATPTYRKPPPYVPP